MDMQERVYSALIISASQSFNSSLKDLLPESKYSPVRTASSISIAKQQISEREFDFIFINSPLPDDSGVRFAVDISMLQSTVTLLFARNDIYGDIYAKLTQYGVFSLEKPVSRAALTQALDWMISMRERLRMFEKKSLSIQEKMEEIRLVNHAKWILISKLKMHEPDAHRYIEKQAMDRCVSKLKIAEEVIQMYS